MFTMMSTEAYTSNNDILNITMHHNRNLRRTSAGKDTFITTKSAIFRYLAIIDLQGNMICYYFLAVEEDKVIPQLPDLLS